LIGGVGGMDAAVNNIIGLLVKSSPDAQMIGKTIAVSRFPLTLGRSGGTCDQCLEDPRVSRQHLEISLVDGAPVCRDMGSTHGVLLNGGKLEGSRPLAGGDVILIGGTQLLVVLNAAVPTSGPAAPAAASGAATPAPKASAGDRNDSLLSRFYADDAQAFKQMVNDEILSRLKQSTGIAGSRVKDAEFRDKVTAMLDTVIEERWYQAPHDIERDALRQLLLYDLLSFGPITPYLEDPSVNEIMVNGPDRVFVERKGRLEETRCRFSCNAHVMTVIQRIVEPLGRRVDESSPRVDARLPDGSRVNAIISPIAIDGPSITIRKFSKERFKGEDLLKFGSLTPGMLQFLREVVRSRQNVIVSGGTGSGKTTLLNVLSHSIPLDERIVTIEDSAELQLNHRNLVRLESRPPNLEGKGEVTIRDLVINSLRMRPDRIIVGECRSREAFDMLQAMNTGHDGSLTTVHANTPRDALLRLENMVMMAGFDLPVVAIREQVASAVDIIVQQTRMVDGGRRITQISEVTGREGDVITMQDIFFFKQTGLSRYEDNKIRVEGYYEATGNIPAFVEEMKRTGDLNIDLSIFKASREESLRV